MADGLLSNVLGAVDRKKQEVKAGLGLLADNPQEWLAQATARYFPTKEEERQYREIKKSGGNTWDTPYTQKLFNLTQFQSSLKPLSKAQLQAASEVAQKNATEMLGLPPNNTAMDRAKALGYEKVSHGTGQGKQILSDRRFDPDVASNDVGGVWTTTSDKYAQWIADHQDSGQVLNLMLRDAGKADVFDIVKEANRIADEIGVPRPENALEAQELLSGGMGWNRVVADALSQTKTPSLKITNFNDAFHSNPNEVTTAFVTKDPSYLRLEDAVFDPKRINENDLLAAGIPIGLLGSTQVELPKKQEKKQKK
jgi:hypothetical protein